MLRDEAIDGLLAKETTMKRSKVSGNETLTPKQEAAALELARGATVGQAAKACGAGESTVGDWKANVPAFKARVEELRAEMTERLFAKFVEGMGEAVDALREMLKEKDKAARQYAIEKMLTHGTNAIQTARVMEQLAALEQQR